MSNSRAKGLIQLLRGPSRHSTDAQSTMYRKQNTMTHVQNNNTNVNSSHPNNGIAGSNIIYARVSGSSVSINVSQTGTLAVRSSWNVMAHGEAREEKWRGNWRMEWVASTLHTTSEIGVSSITTADAHNSAASSRLNWRPCRFKWTLPFHRKTKSGFCTCAITFQTQSTYSQPGRFE